MDQREEISDSSKEGISAADYIKAHPVEIATLQEKKTEPSNGRQNSWK